MEKTLEELLTARGIDENGIVQRTGRTFDDSFSLSDEEYRGYCEDFKRSVEGSGKKDDSSSEFKKERFIKFVASDETTDSYGDILRVDGADLSRYNSKSAAFIDSHNLGSVFGALGILVKASKVNNFEGIAGRKAVIASVYFPTAEESEDADKAFRLYKSKMLNGVSVGFKPLEVYFPKSEEERKALGLGKYGVEFRKWQPYELSAVLVGANPKALAIRAAGAGSSYAELVATVGELTKGFSALQETITKILSEPKPQEQSIEKSLQEYLKSNPLTFNLNV